MADKDDKLESLDTVPPPASGDAYSAETVQRVVPPELLAEAKKELLKRPRLPKKAAPTPRTPLAPAPLPMIERIFEDEDSASDEAETLMHSAQSAKRSVDGARGGERDGGGVAESAPSSGHLAHSTASIGLRSSPSPRRSAMTDGWWGSALIFLGSLLLVLLIGALLLSVFVER